MVYWAAVPTRTTNYLPRVGTPVASILILQLTIFLRPCTHHLVGRTKRTATTLHQTANTRAGAYLWGRTGGVATALTGLMLIATSARAACGSATAAPLDARNATVRAETRTPEIDATVG